jgi:hypothetical protein
VSGELSSPIHQTPAARKQLRAAIFVAAGQSRSNRDVAALLRGALPEAFVEIGRAFSGLDREALLGSVAARRLGITHAQLQTAARNGIFEEVCVHDGGYRRAQYSVKEIDDAATAWRTSSPLELVGRLTGLPRYACERIVGCGDIQRECHPYVLHRTEQPRVVSSSIDQYVSSIKEACTHDVAPLDAVRISSAMRAVGGRLKPWQHVLAAIRRGHLPCWITEGSAPLIQRLLVRPSQAERFAGLDADSGLSADAFLSDHMSQIDAMAVLNLRQIDGPILEEAGILSPLTGTRSFLFPTEDVLAVAADWISTSEASARMGISPVKAYHLLEWKFGARPSAAGWSRAAFEKAFGVVPLLHEKTRFAPGMLSASQAGTRTHILKPTA